MAFLFIPIRAQHAFDRYTARFVCCVAHFLQDPTSAKSNFAGLRWISVSHMQITQRFDGKTQNIYTFEFNFRRKWVFRCAVRVRRTKDNRQYRYKTQCETWIFAEALFKNTNQIFASKISEIVCCFNFSDQFWFKRGRFEKLFEEKAWMEQGSGLFGETREFMGDRQFCLLRSNLSNQETKAAFL